MSKSFFAATLSTRMPERKALARTWVLFVCCMAASFFLLAYPFYIIQPFKHQDARQLAVALAILQSRPYLQAVLAIFALVLLFLYWRRSARRIGRIFAVLLTLATIGFGLLSRLNIYELMFHPIADPAFTAASASKLDGAEQVIAIRVNNAARAYPIRIISYHHIVNDVVAGIPVVATY